MPKRQHSRLWMHAESLQGSSACIVKLEQQPSKHLCSWRSSEFDFLQGDASAKRLLPSHNSEDRTSAMILARWLWPPPTAPS
mmetsp:Transcript_83694/g.194662  ORF Transcript_83694/g.194662 Transcript_83694/m.194662 type:complete len:82 (-) Transcript_83694:79-324(-)